MLPAGSCSTKDCCAGMVTAAFCGASVGVIAVTRPAPLEQLAATKTLLYTPKHGSFGQLSLPAATTHSALPMHSRRKVSRTTERLLSHLTVLAATASIFPLEQSVHPVNSAASEYSQLPLELRQPKEP